jgi:ADP-ribosylglycohydrolase
MTDPGAPSGFAPEVLRAALYFVDTSKTFPDALHRAIAFAGSANYCPVLVGAIAGARWGASTIPANDLEHVGILPRIRATAGALSNGWAPRVPRASS